MRDRLAEIALLDFVQESIAQLRLLTGRDTDRMRVVLNPCGWARLVAEVLGWPDLTVGATDPTVPCDDDGRAGTLAGLPVFVVGGPIEAKVEVVAPGLPIDHGLPKLPGERAGVADA